jgi:hypothetical protein
VPPPQDLAGRPLLEHSGSATEIFCRFQVIPDDFFCKYFSATGLLKQDHDDGFCPPVAIPVCFPSTTTSTTSTTTSSTSTTSTTTSTTSTTTSTTSTTTTTSSTTTLPEHFQCYEIKPAAFVQVPVTVEDQFGTLQGNVRFPHRLCAPADKNGEGIGDPTEHLTGYTFKVPFTKQLNQTTVDQFGTLQLDVVRPDFLMVPTAKNGVPIAPPPSDHFVCYKVKPSRGGPKFVKRTVTVADQFETVTLDVQKPARLCAPASKNGEDPTAPSHPDHLLCYKARAQAKFGTIDVTIDNQFGPDQVTIVHRRELCVPALKNPPPPTTTSTTASTTTTTTLCQPDGAPCTVQNFRNCCSQACCLLGQPVGRCFDPAEGCF